MITSQRFNMDTICDFVRGGESDTGGLTSVPCPRCKKTHYTSASRIGWFVYECRKAIVVGHVTNWPSGAINLYDQSQN